MRHLLVAGAIGLSAACGARGASVEGQVFEVANSEAPESQWNRVSSADAYVIVHWTGSVPGPHASTACLHATVGKTDERGRFDVSGWWAAPRLVFQSDPAVMVYKPGFDQHSEFHNPRSPFARTLVRSKLPVEQRISLLSAYADAGCRDNETLETTLADTQGVAASFYRALYEEALALGPISYELNHHLATLREKAGVPQPPEPPWIVDTIRAQPSLAAPVPIAAAGQTATFDGVTETGFVFESAPFASAHASTIVESPDGLVAAWFGGTREGAPDVGIWLSRRVNGEWTRPIEVATGIQPDGGRHPCWNPVLFARRDRTLMLFYKVGPNPRSWWGMLRTSRDSGRTWTDARRLPDGILGPIKNKPVQLRDGTLLAPSSTESPESPSKWRVHFERSGDAGLTWTAAAPSASADGSAIDAIQPSILVHPGDRLQALGRSRSQRVFETWSDDGGRSWTPIALTQLPNPNSGIDAVTLRDGRHLIVYNHTPKGRSPLNVSVSRDGKVWDAALSLEREPGEYSYPAIIEGSDGQVHVTYTWKRQRIKHVAIDPARLKPVPMPEGNWPQEVR